MDWILDNKRNERVGHPHITNWWTDCETLRFTGRGVLVDLQIVIWLPTTERQEKSKIILLTDNWIWPASYIFEDCELNQLASQKTERRRGLIGTRRQVRWSFWNISWQPPSQKQERDQKDESNPRTLHCSTWRRFARLQIRVVVSWDSYSFHVTYHFEGCTSSRLATHAMHSLHATISIQNQQSI